MGKPFKVMVLRQRSSIFGSLEGTTETKEEERVGQ